MRAFIAAEFFRNPQEGAIEHGAIIVDDVDQPRLYDEAAEFDQLARALAPLYLPFACARSRLHRFQPMPPGRQAPFHSPHRDQVAPPLFVPCVDSSPRPLCATPPLRWQFSSP